ncbi:MAG: helix-turn-helix domain-containing protein [Christensenellaceae bacterium]|nr:helix-turn-helix domain-containing protein [Christensenellaceae bacterium]
MLNLTQTSINRYEKETAFLSYETLMRYANYLDVSFD